MKINQLRGVLIAATCCVWLVGCAAEAPTFPVSGTVTQGGTPVEGAAVTFVPAEGDSAVGITDASGVYNLKTKTRDGALPGSYRVTIAKYEGGADDSAAAEEPTPAADPYDITEEYPDDYDEAKESDKAAGEVSENVLPQRYADANKSGLSADVVEGDNTHDFELDKR